jgi:hypothetical protein
VANDLLILPRADSGCGKVFYSDRRTAEGHRIALGFWHRATGYTRPGYQLTVHRCPRCGGFHISQRRIEKPPLKPSVSQGDTAGCRENALDSAIVTTGGVPTSREKRQYERPYSHRMD